MYARISRAFQFQSGIYFENSLLLNVYDLNLEMEVNSESIYEQNIALERIKYFVSHCLESCIFVNSSNKSVIDSYIKANLKVSTLPDEPYDQVVAAILLSKFNVITEKKLEITQIQIASKLSDDVIFYVDSNEIADFINVPNSWWLSNNTSIINLSKNSSKREKIVELKKEPTDWNSLGLSYQLPENNENGNAIVFNIAESKPFLL